MVCNVLFNFGAGTAERDSACCGRLEGGAASFIRCGAKDPENDNRPLGHFILNKCFVSVPSLLFITNKYLSTESLVPRCYTVLHYYCGPAVWLPARPRYAQALPVSFSLLEWERESKREREGDIYACPACLLLPFKQVSCQVMCLVGFAVHKLCSHTRSLTFTLALAFSYVRVSNLYFLPLYSPFLSYGGKHKLAQKMHRHCYNDHHS